jgi:hypothetical protein
MAAVFYKKTPFYVNEQVFGHKRDNSGLKKVLCGQYCWTYALQKQFYEPQSAFFMGSWFHYRPL